MKEKCGYHLASHWLVLYPPISKNKNRSCSVVASPLQASLTRPPTPVRPAVVVMASFREIHMAAWVVANRHQMQCLDELAQTPYNSVQPCAKNSCCIHTVKVEGKRRAKAAGGPRWCPGGVKKQVRQHNTVMLVHVAYPS